MAVEAPFLRACSEHSPAILLGRLYHSLVKAVADVGRPGASTDAILNDVFPRVAQEFRSRYPNFNLEYDPFVQRIYDTVARYIDFKFDSFRQLFVETEISSSDQLLFGTPDWVMIQGGRTSLIDFKLTTNLERLRTSKNMSQLSFYAYLVEEAYGQYPVSISLVGLNGIRVEVPIPRDVALMTAADARERLDVIGLAKRERLNLEDLASPSLEVCIGCRHNGVCRRSMALG